MGRTVDRYRWGGMVTGWALATLVVAVPAWAGEQYPVISSSDLASRENQDRDLAVIRSLNDRVRRGEITEQERALLWQAYLARVSASDRSAAEAPTTKSARFPIFTGPGL